MIASKWRENDLLYVIHTRPFLLYCKALPLETKKPPRWVSDQGGFLKRKLFVLGSLCLSSQFVNCQRIKSLLRKVGDFPHWLSIHAIFLQTSKRQFHWSLLGMWRRDLHSVQTIDCHANFYWLNEVFSPDWGPTRCASIHFQSSISQCSVATLEEFPSNRWMTRSELPREPFKAMAIMRCKAGIFFFYGHSLAWDILLLCPWRTDHFSGSSSQ